MDTQESVSKVRNHVSIEKLALSIELSSDPKRIHEQPAANISILEASY